MSDFAHRTDTGAPDPHTRRGVLEMLGAVGVLFAGGTGYGIAASRADWVGDVSATEVPNLHRVSRNLYRSAQPTTKGFWELHEAGIRAVLNLRPSVDDRTLAIDGKFAFYHVPMRASQVDADNSQRIVTALRDLRLGLRRGPTLVHCTYGSDRTGLIVALWRILFEGRTKSDAIAEMRSPPYGFHEFWANIPAYIAHADIADLRARVEAAM